MIALSTYCNVIHLTCDIMKLLVHPSNQLNPKHIKEIKMSLNLLKQTYFETFVPFHFIFVSKLHTSIS